MVESTQYIISYLEMVIYTITADCWSPSLATRTLANKEMTTIVLYTIAGVPCVTRTVCIVMFALIDVEYIQATYAYNNDIDGIILYLQRLMLPKVEPC